MSDIRSSIALRFRAILQTVVAFVKRLRKPPMNFMDDFEAPRYRHYCDMLNKLIYRNPGSLLAGLLAVATAIAQVVTVIFPKHELFTLAVIYAIAIVLTPIYVLRKHYQRYEYRPSQEAKRLLLAAYQSTEKDLLCCWVGNQYLVSSWDRCLTEAEKSRRDQIVAKEKIALSEASEILIANKAPILAVQTDYEQRRLQAIIQNELVAMGFFEFNPNKQLSSTLNTSLDPATTLTLGLTPRGAEYAKYLIEKNAGDSPEDLTR